MSRAPTTTRRERWPARSGPGWVTINHAFDMNAAFGGYKHSGNGREWSEFGFHEYLEVKSTLGYAPEKAAQ